MKEILVAGAAPAPDPDGFYRRLLCSADAVVAADGAAAWCVALGRAPEAVVGDMDSASEEVIAHLQAAGATILRHPRDKDVTDLDLAVRYAQERWEAGICLTAAYSGRLDHTLAALGALSRAGARARIAEPTWRGWVCTPTTPLRVAVPPGTTFSVIALSDCEGVSVSGAHWELADASLPVLDGRGVSNEAQGPDLRIGLRAGSLVVIVNDVLV